MTWDFGSITSSTPALDLVTKIKSAMTTSGYYTAVDDYTPTSGSILGYRFHVLYNSTAGFYVILRNPTSNTGTVYYWLTEQYNSTNHTCTYLAQAYTSQLPSANNYGLVNSNSGTLTNIPFTSITTDQPGWNTNTTGFSYAISATQDRVCVATYVGTTATGPYYIGKFESFYRGIGGPNALVDPGPFMSGASAGVQYQAAFSRLPTNSTNLTTINNELRYPGFGEFAYLARDLGAPGALSFQFDGIVINRIMIYHSTTSPARGLLIGMIAMPNSGSYVFGDELSVNGTAKYKVINSNRAMEMI